MSDVQAKFIISNSDYRKCPAPDIPEYAFCGRSNVGKSSLINMITQRKSLAKTSQKPGKTQLINHFLIDELWYLADLPGYGYAAASKDARMAWEKFIFEYLANRENLMCVFVLLDCRHKPQKIDLEFMEWLGESEVPFVMVFTKTDKLSKTALEKNLVAYKEEMMKYWEELPPMFQASSLKKEGRDELLKFIADTNPLFVKP